MNPNDYILKSITLDVEKYSNFLTMSNEDAGEFIKYLLQYAMDGKRPKMSNAWKQNMYNMYECTITEQMAALQKKRNLASQKAKEREKIKKEAMKLLKSEKAKAKATAADVAVDDANISESAKVAEDTDSTAVTQTVDVVTPDVLSNNGSSPEVTSEDLSFSHFVAVLGKKDNNHKCRSEAETAWNKMSEESKRNATTWLKNYVITYPDINDRKFPCALINAHPWDVPEVFS